MSADHTRRNSGRRQRVAVFGEWGETNLGDWAIYQGVRQFFTAQGALVDAYRCGALQPFESSAKTPVDNAAAGNKPHLTSLLNGNAMAMRLLKRSVRGLRQEWLVRRLMPRLAQADLVCVGGGALLCDSNLHFPQSLIAIMRAVQALRKPLWCLGCSAEGDWTPRGAQMIMEFLENCDAIAVRDIATAERLADATGRLVPLFGDFALPDRPQASTRRAHARTYILGINVSQIAPPWNSYQEHYEDMVVSLASRFLIGSDEQRTIALFTTGTPQDLGPLQRVQQRLAASGSTTTIHPRHLDELENVLDESEIVVATRLHAAIISLARGRPVIGLSPTPKIGNLFESIGLARFFFQIPRATVTDVIRTMGDRVALDRQWDLMDQSRCWQTRRELADRLHQLGMRRMAS